MDGEILEVEIELNDGSKHNMQIQEIDSSEWDQIPQGTKGLICLVNNDQLLVEIESSSDDGISFKTIGGSQLLHYDEEVIRALYIEIPSE